MQYEVALSAARKFMRYMRAENIYTSPRACVDADHSCLFNLG